MSGHACSCLLTTTRIKSLEPAARFAYQLLMEEPSPRKSRLILAGGLTAIIVVGGVGFLLGRATTEPAQIVVAPPAAAPKAAPDPAPISSVLGRSDIMALASAAADAAAAGRAPGPEVAQAAGRRFELRLPFGCNGPAPESSDAGMRWRYDAADQALRVHVDPVSWSADDWWPRDTPEEVDAIEGFWISRPWTSSEACPASGQTPSAAGSEPVMLPGQTLAIGQMFFASGGRGGRRDGEPYEAVVRVPENQLSASKGFHLQLSGRIARTPGGGPVQCRQPERPEQRPVCLISVVIDEVAIENAASGAPLATWDVSARDAPRG